MNKHIQRIAAIAILSFPINAAWAQAPNGTGSNLLNIILLSTLLILLVAFIGDRLLKLSAANAGAGRSGGYSIFPSFQELFGAGRKNYVGEDEVFTFSKGHDIRLAGTAKTIVEEGNSATYAVKPVNFIGNRPIPKMLVEEGATVKAGDPIFFDKNNPAILYAAPVSGEIVEVRRGEKRAITEIIIKADTEQQYKSYDLPAIDGDRKALVDFMIGSGLWPGILQRPFNTIADPEDVPRDIFISTFDSAPLSPDLNLVVEGQGTAFQKGLDVLSKLTSGSVHLGLNGGKDDAPSSIFTDASGVEKTWFNGPHPAGNVGVQLHHVAPLAKGDVVWTLSIHEVIKIGRLFESGKYDTSRIVAVTGAELVEPKYFKTFQGANVGELLNGNLKSDHVRFVSGDVLTGATVDQNGYMDFYDDQITVLAEGDYYEMFGWLLPLTPRPSLSKTFPHFLYKKHNYVADTNTHGEHRAFVVTGEYERVLPMNILPQHLFKAILARDLERMEGLGILELVEEDVALCEFACTSKQNLQTILREGLEIMRDQG